MNLFSRKTQRTDLFSRTGSESESAQFGRDAGKDWRILFISFLVLGIVSIGVNVYMYGQINRGEIFTSLKKTVVSRQTFDRFALEKAVASFGEKAESFDALLRRPPVTEDPFIAEIKAAR